MTPSSALIAYCRAGFESEAGADLLRLAGGEGARLDLAAAPDGGYVIGRIVPPLREPRTDPWRAALAAATPIFARSMLHARGPYAIANAAATAGAHGQARVDRVTPLMAAIDAWGPAPWQSAWVEFPDTNDGKSLSSLARALGTRIEASLRARGALAHDAPRRLHIFLVDGATAWLGETPPSVVAWPLGIPRLRKPGGAPSRSTLKLAEAFATFLGEREPTLLRPGMHAVDLGAAPGGWTWQLAQRGLRVVAVDNGPLKGSVAADALVTHVRGDGFRWRPRKAVDWVVCDIVEQPIRIAELMARWVVEGAARRAIFNLKLPMKKRFAEVERCEQRIGEMLRHARLPMTLRIRQLYHDREEVTAYLAPLP